LIIGIIRKEIAIIVKIVKNIIHFNHLLVFTSIRTQRTNIFQFLVIVNRKIITR
jgi:hypothetical protein